MHRQFRLTHLLLAGVTGWLAGSGLLLDLAVLGAGLGGLLLLAAVGTAVAGGGPALRGMAAALRSSLRAVRRLLRAAEPLGHR